MPKLFSLETRIYILEAIYLNGLNVIPDVEDIPLAKFIVRQTHPRTTRYSHSHLLGLSRHPREERKDLSPEQHS